ncbi:uncharacterized protein B0T23DRAFT_374705 [Neurospora hispaniola]|uniref:Uncharacterized protein n=1 Tax=Neurospora hispaniola TaxID=588809 RepID=A0AAJ0ID91_9PEZI|nr:hypothetical protein B0T23DRAFT_374705 [Neurospora hispaniola]
MQILVSLANILPSTSALALTALSHGRDRISAREELPGRITSDLGVRAVEWGCLQISPGVWDVFFFLFFVFLLFAAVSFSSLSRIENGASSVMFVIDIDDKGPPGIQYYGKTRISHPYQTLFNFVSDQDNGVLRQAIVVVDNTTGHKVPVHSAPTSDNNGEEPDEHHCGLDWSMARVGRLRKKMLSQKSKAVKCNK